MRFANQPHRSSNTYRGEYIRPATESKVIIRFAISREELLDALSAISPFSVAHNSGTDAISWLEPIPEIAILQCSYRGGDPSRSNSGVAAKLVSARLEHVSNINPTIGAESSGLIVEAGALKPVPAHQNVNPTDYRTGLAAFALRAVYAFKAERYNLGTAPAGNSGILAPDASNLAEVLSVLQKHPTQWHQFRTYARAVFPNVYDISVGPAGPNVVEVQIWNEPPQGLPKELAVSVSESGTGIGQVLAILAVVVMAGSRPRTIIIDEPQSFLHPGALRTLVEILAEHDQHQFIIATHSPIVITAAVPAQILKTVRNGPVTAIQQIDLEKNEHLRAFLRDVGARLSERLWCRTNSLGRRRHRGGLLS